MRLRPPATLPSVCAALFLACAALGCAEKRVVRSGWHQFEAWDDRSADKSSARKKKSGERDIRAVYGWGLSLASFEGVDRLARARQLAREYQVEKPLYAENNGTLEVFIGHYEKADDDKAQKELRQWQRVEKKDGSRYRAFPDALVRPLPTERKPKTDDPLDADQFHGHATWLVGFYTEDFGKNWREEAQRVAKILRKEGPDGHGGVEAYFRINEEGKEAAVLVGLFTKHDHWIKKQVDGQNFFTDAPGPAAEEVLNRFPFLLNNNKKVPVTGLDAGHPAEFQKPQLVELLE